MGFCELSASSPNERRQKRTAVWPNFRDYQRRCSPGAHLRLPNSRQPRGPTVRAARTGPSCSHLLLAHSGLHRRSALPDAGMPNTGQSRPSSQAGARDLAVQRHLRLDSPATRRPFAHAGARCGRQQDLGTLSAQDLSAPWPLIRPSVAGGALAAGSAADRQWGKTRPDQPRRGGVPLWLCQSVALLGVVQAALRVVAASHLRRQSGNDVTFASSWSQRPRQGSRLDHRRAVRDHGRVVLRLAAAVHRHGSTGCSAGHQIEQLQITT